MDAASDRTLTAMIGILHRDVECIIGERAHAVTVPLTSGLPELVEKLISEYEEAVNDWKGRCLAQLERNGRLQDENRQLVRELDRKIGAGLPGNAD